MLLAGWIHGWPVDANEFPEAENQRRKRLDRQRIRNLNRAFLACAQ